MRASRSWWDIYFGLFGGHYVAASIGTSAFLLGLGAGVSWLIGFEEVYLRTTPIYLGVFGIAWVGCCIGWTNNRLPSLIEEIRPAFISDDAQFERVSSAWLRRMADIKIHLIGTMVLIFAAWLVVVLATRFPERVSSPLSYLEAQVAWMELKGQTWFPVLWSQEPYLWVKNGIIGVFAIPILLLIFTGACGIVTYARFVTSVSKLPMVSFLELARARLRPIANLGIATGLAWSVGVSLLVGFFQAGFELVSLSVVPFLTALGIIMVFWPQYAIHTGLSRTKRSLLDIVLTRAIHTRPEPPAVVLFDSKGNPVRTSNRVELDRFVQHALEPHIQQLDIFIRSVSGANTWVYRPADALVVVGTWLLPLGVLAFGEWL